MIFPIFAFVIEDTNVRERIFALLSVLAAGLSGYFAIAKQVDEHPEFFRESVLVIAFRRIANTDESLAIFLIQIAIIYQAIATLSEAMTNLMRFIHQLL